MDRLFYIRFFLGQMKTRELELRLFKSIEEQIKSLRKGTAEVRLTDSATISRGIFKIKTIDRLKYVELFKNFSGTCAKFVPASGAASRMFKVLVEMQKKDSSEKTFFLENISKLPFFHLLEEKSKSTFNTSIQSIIESDDLKKLSNLILSKEGLNFGEMPKGLIPINTYDSKVKTCFQEQLSEAEALFFDKGNSLLHFTVPAKFETIISDHIALSTKKACEIKIEFSVQLPETNTVSLNSKGEVLRNQSGELITRPGGHGALIYNLNKIDSDVIFIKNIDNVTHLKNLNEQIFWKQLLGGHLIELQDKLHHFQRALRAGELIQEEVIEFYKEKFYKNIKPSEISQVLFRPIRVCGMVKNEGQPGGGPFFIKKNNEISLQIVESAEINKSDPAQLKILNSSTHFNPVDIVCGVKDYEGNKYELLEFVDDSAFFVSQKNFGEEELTVLELPGLWNGAMCNWNTVFVEVPADTFNPVKTVNDLIKNVD